MASLKKRGRQEMEAVEPPPEEPSLLERIRNMWEFANLAQWIFIFGKAVKIDENIGIEELEMECLKSSSTILPDIGLALLKFVSSHRGLTPEILNEFTRRQYVAKAPTRNPFGEGEEPNKFAEFDIFTKIRVLQQLTRWTMGNPERIRNLMEEQKDTEQTIWRIEPFGWDSEDRTYIVLDDNRLYRRTDAAPPQPPAAKNKKISKKAKAASRRASKRRKFSETMDSEADVEENETGDQENVGEKEIDTFGGMKWECLAVSLDEFNSVIASFDKTRDPNEKVLRKRIIDDVLPLLEKQEESRKKKQAQKERELLNLEKLATAKRSSRIAGKMEQHKHDEELREAERKKHADLIMAKKEQEKWQKLEKERESRMQTREQRLKERDARRILHEEELANLSEDSKKIEAGGRLSERHRKAAIERNKQELEKLAEDEDDWIFDCSGCGAYGQIDDGTHSIACDKCNIWQHSKCVGVSQAEADRKDFTFICKTCVRRAKDEERAKTHPPIRIKLNNRPGSSSSQIPPSQNHSPAVIHPQPNGSTAIDSSPQIGQLPQQRIPNTEALQVATKGSSTATAQPSNGQQESSQRSSQSLPLASTTHTTYSGPYGSSPSKEGLAYSHLASSQSTGAQSFSSLLANGGSQPQTMPTQQPLLVQTPTQPSAPRYPALPGSPSLTTNGGQGRPPSQMFSVPRPGSSNNSQRRSSINLPSPLAGPPPILTPVTKTHSITNFPISSPVLSYTPKLNPGMSSPPRAPGSSQPTAEVVTSQPNPLIAGTPGFSPTKHSPPRAPPANGSFGSATPTMLPPVASLSPSPPFQDLTPPVKPSYMEDLAKRE